MFLMAMSIIFIVIELKARFDRSFLIFGITNLLFSFFCAIDIWIQPGLITIYWTRIQHIISAFFPFFILWYLMILVHQIKVKILKLMFAAGVFFSILFCTNFMMKETEREITSTLLYNITFAPYMISSMIGIVVFLFVYSSKTAERERKVLIFHRWGIGALALGGILDLTTIFIGHREIPEIATYSILGLLLFGMIVTYVFIDRLTEIIRTREITFGKLQAAYKELEEVQTLKELGQSTAIINHEIKNYTFMISSSAELLYSCADLSEKYKKITANIVTTAMKMSDFSKEILNFSRAKILGDKRQIALFNLIGECVKTHFTEKQAMVSIDNDNRDLFIHGDWQKLEHVFVNIIKNSFEAETTHLSIKAIRRDTVLVLVIEDDGIGCTEEQLGSIFKSFYTTKKGRGGTGLGMCLSRSIVESHGGYINAYSKNLLKNGTHGLILTMAFPIYQEGFKEIEDKKDPVMLIKEGVENLAQIIKVFQNVMITPYIVQKADEIDSKKISLEKIEIYGTADSINKFRKRFGPSGHTHTLFSNAQGIVFVVNEEKDKNIFAFSEQYVLENLG
jgi:signal transduction histidine kinase